MHQENKRMSIWFPKIPLPKNIMLDPDGNWCPIGWDGYLEDEIELTSEQQEIILKKVKMILEDENKMKNIMAKYDKEKEDSETYQNNIINRIEELLIEASKIQFCESKEKEKNVEDEENVEVITWTQYLQAVFQAKRKSKGRKILLRRDIDEVYTNNYNSEILMCVNSNMDIQVAENFYAYQIIHIRLLVKRQFWNNRCVD